MKLDPQKEFIIFTQSFIGLRGKNYDSKLTSLPKFLGKKINKFILENKCDDMFIVNNHFSDKLEISKEDMEYIIQQLIDYK